MESTDDTGLFAGYSGRGLLLISFGFATLQASRLVIPPLLPSIIREFAISEFLAGVALSVLWGLYALCQYVSGRLSDELTTKTLLVSGLTVMSMGLVLLAAAPNYGVFLAAAAIVGFSSGLYPTAAYSLVSELFVERRGNAIGFYTSGADLGGVAAAGLAILALSVGVWQLAFLPVIVAGSTTAVAIHVWNRQEYQFTTVPLEIREAVRRLRSDSRVLLLLLAYSSYLITWQGFTGFLPSFLQSAKGFSPDVASAGFAALFLFGALTKPIAGWLSDRTHRLNVASVAILFGIAMLIVLLIASNTVVVVIAVIGFAVGLMSLPPVIQSHMLDIFPDANKGSDLGSIRTVSLGIGSVGPSLTGFLVSRVGYDPAFASLAGFLTITEIVLLWLILTRR